MSDSSDCQSCAKAYVDDDSRSEIGDAALSSDAPHIPGPMVFDLVRPLGVRQGDLEVNTLSGHYRVQSDRLAGNLVNGLCILGVFN
ncbi:MAG: hypothetical protein PSU93_02820 [Methylobacter sp.]|uniref:Uncharacterized protein n=1 Tax=Candidatus Methylobacter titanis TaxID=3053457 RepID=A0AA43TH95_9GAMM|nr:hypothetical protein [Candidatus Methylobacter titanis]